MNLRRTRPDPAVERWTIVVKLYTTMTKKGRKSWTIMEKRKLCPHTGKGIRFIPVKIELPPEYLEELKKRKEALNGKRDNPIWKEYVEWK